MSEQEKCPKCGELKTACKCQKEGADNGGKKSNDVQEVKIKVDTGNMEAVLKRLAEVEERNKKLEEDAKKILEDKKKVETSLESEKTLKEDYESKLKIIGEQKLNEKRKVIMDKAKEVIKDEARLKEIEEGIKNPENLKATESLVDTFYNVLKQGEKEHSEQAKKEKEEMDKKLAEKEGGKGSVAMTPEMLALEKNNKTANGYSGETMTEAHRAMVRDLRKQSHSDDPVVAARAKAILDEFVKKWAAAVKTNYDGRVNEMGKIGPSDIKQQPSLREITKKGGEAI